MLDIVEEKKMIQYFCDNVDVVNAMIKPATVNRVPIKTESLFPRNLFSDFSEKRTMPEIVRAGAALTLKEAGPLPLTALFKRMKMNGHKVTSTEVLYHYLRQCPNDFSCKPGQGWSIE